MGTTVVLVYHCAKIFSAGESYAAVVGEASTERRCLLWTEEEDVLYGAHGLRPVHSSDGRHEHKGVERTCAAEPRICILPSSRCDVPYL